jgi:hypothetical protein
MDQSLNRNQGDPDTNYTDAGDVNNSKLFAISITDPDTDLNNMGAYQVFFQVKKATDASFSDDDPRRAIVQIYKGFTSKLDK